MIPSKILDKISSIYTNTKSDIISPNNNLEIEVRFGNFNNDKLCNGISRVQYNYLLNFFLTNSKPINVTNLIYIYKNTRKIVEIVNNTEKSPIWQVKKKFWSYISEDYPFKITASNEININPIKNYKYNYIRKINRKSFLLYNSSMRLDLSIINSKSVPDTTTELNISDFSKLTDTNITFEIELEILNLNYIKFLDSAISIIFKECNQSIETYTQSEKTTIIEYINFVLGGWSFSKSKNIIYKNSIDSNLFTQVRNLKINDLVWGGLIGNEITSYTITHKADGIRRILVFHPSGIWMTMYPNQISKISSDVPDIFIGTILDGEYIPSNIRKPGSPNTKIWYIILDCLSTPNKSSPSIYGDSSIQYQSHIKRLIFCQWIADLIKNENLYLTIKSYKELSDPERFFSLVSQMISEKHLLPYNQDGFIFTPINLPYTHSSCKYPLSKRILTKFSDTCKWKPLENQTIDFSIKTLSDNTLQFHNTSIHNNNKLILFTGSKKFPFNNSSNINDHPLTQNLPDYSIVEYSWDSNLNKFIPLKIRYEKHKPNRIDFAISIWENINFPISLDTLSGSDFVLVRKYHNRIKSHLYKLDLSTNQSSDKTLLDIGSGKGGDLSKWLDYSKIICVEPNNDNLIELKKRIITFNMQDRVRIVETTAENTDEILKAIDDFLGHGSKVSTISLMLSLSFFWKSESTLNSLVNTILSTISDTGNIIFLTIDGDIVEHIFQPTFVTGLPITTLKLGNTFLNLSNTQLFINIPNSIVNNQDEYLVHLDDLILLLSDKFKLSEINRADKERFLNSAELRFTQMYTYGIFTHK